MENRVALIGFVIENNDSVEALNKLLHNYKDYIESNFMVGQNLKFDIQLFSLENNASFGDVKTYKINGVFFDYLDRHVVVFSDNVFNSSINSSVIKNFLLFIALYLIISFLNSVKYPIVPLVRALPHEEKSSQ